MKKNIIICLYSLNNVVFSQQILSSELCQKNGYFFKSADDFIKKSPADSVCLDNSNNKIKTNSQYKVIIREGSEKRIYKKENVFAYSNGEGTYRFYKDESKIGPIGYFKIENIDGLILYSQIQYTSTRYSSWTSVKMYYSISLDSPIKLLSQKNLSIDFDNKDFLIQIAKQLELLNNSNSRERSLIILEIKKTFDSFYEF